MFGLSFLNSIFLVGLVTAAIPVIIHLLNRRRIRRVKFSSLEFLDDVTRRRMSKINLRRILILVLRTLAVLFLVTAFARPTLRNSAFFLPGKAPKNVIVCLDASYSMGLQLEQGTAFTAAKKAARDVIDQAGKNDVMNVVLFSNHAEPLLDRGTRNKTLVKNTIDAAQLTEETTSIHHAVDKALELIDKSDVEGGEIYVISDFRYNQDSTVVSPNQRRKGVRIYFLPVSEEHADNVSIDRVAIPRKLLRPGEVIRVAVTVTNHATEDPVNFPLELRVDGNRKAEKMISLAPQASSTVTFPISFADRGRYHCSVSKDRDRLPVDDQRYFLLEVSKSVPVTLVRGLRRVGPSSDSAPAGFYYLEKALNPRGTSDAEFVVRTVDERDVTASVLPARGVVVWVDPQQLGANRLALLDRYVRRGGGLMVFLGGSNHRLLREDGVRRLLGMRGATERSGSAQVGYTSFRKDHPIFDIFDEDELALLARTRVSSYVSVTGVAPDSVLAYTGSGDPAIWECTRGKGRILVFAAAPDLQSGDIPLSPMFLPLVHTSVSYLASAGEAQRQPDNFVGAPLAFDAPPSAITASRLVIRDPDEHPIEPAVFETPAGDTRVVCERPPRIGFYRLLSDTSLVDESVVNLDTRESDLTATSVPTGKEKASVVPVDAGLAHNLQARREGREVFAAFLFLALAALVAESVLGRKA